MRRATLVVLVLMSGVFGCAVHDSTQEAKVKIPAQISSFDPTFHFPPVDQGSTSSCWSFSTVSFLETEAARLGLPQVKLAVMYPVYYGFVEKARYFVQTRGESRFSPGDLFTTVLEVVQKYGIVPDENYPGRPTGETAYNHNALYKELKAYIARVKEEGLWDETEVVAEVKSILDKHLGKPPETFEYKGRSYTPKSFQQEFVALPWQDYLLVTSFEYAPFHTFTELRVPDNWRKNSRYYNVPLETFYEGLKDALRAGYSAAIDGDISEPGRVGPQDIATIPADDIPYALITQEAREKRFLDKRTKDDHLMHIVGMTRSGGHDWFLVKDSWRDAWEGKHKGYFFYRGDFVKLKVLAYLVHEGALPTLRAD
jgi:bleomycin hydrolase